MSEEEEERGAPGGASPSPPSSPPVDGGVSSPRASRTVLPADRGAPESPPGPAQAHPFAASKASSEEGEELEAGAAAPPAMTESQRSEGARKRQSGRDKRREERERMDAVRQHPSARANPVRRFLFDNVTSRRWFERLILAFILANCITLAMADPRNDNEALERAELVFAAVFALEMVLKLAAMGLFHEGGYFRDPWNRLDFVIVVVGFLSLLPGVGNYTSVRVLRVLRPLRTINSVAGVRVIVRTLLRSLGKLGDVVVLLLFFFTLYGVVGVQLFVGTLRQRCFPAGDPAAEPLDFCRPGSGTGFHCPAPEVCLRSGAPPEEGLVGFDNFGVAALTLYQTMTLSDWPGVMLALQDGTSGYAWIYFVSFIVLVGWFAVNLVLAVISDEFAGLSDEARQDEREELEEELRAASAKSIPLDRLESHGTEFSATATGSVFDKGGGAAAADALDSDEDDADDFVDDDDYVDGAAAADEDAAGKEPGVFERLASRPSVLESAAAGRAPSHLSDAAIAAVASFKSSSAAAAAPGKPPRESSSASSVAPANSAVPRPVLEPAALGEDVLPLLQAARREHLEQEAYLSGKPGLFRRAHALAVSPGFEKAIAAVIMLNTLCLAVEYHGMSAELERGLYAANVAFTAVFTAEMVLKLAGLGFACYLSDGFNVFDGTVVLLSLAELALRSGGAFSVFRALRLLRVLRLAKARRSLRILLLTVAASFGSMSYMAGMLGLHLFTFAVLGMQLYSGKFPDDSSPVATRANYDGFGASLLSVFQQVTGDAWNTLMVAASAGTSQASGVTFSLVVTASGIYLVLSLFVAILLEGFGAQDDRTLELDALGDRARQVAAARPYSEARAQRRLARALRARRLAAYRADLRREEQARLARLPPVMDDTRTCGLFSTRSPVRRLCWRVVQSTAFEVFITLAIVANCVLLAMDNPGVDGDSSLGRTIKVGDWVFAALFTAEMVLKLVALGARSYFADNFNRLDFAVVVGALFALLFPGVSVVRSLRGLRPLRLVVKNANVRVVIESLYRAVPAIGNVVLFCILFWTIFGILGVSLFGGRLRSCEGDPSLDRAACAAAGREWARAPAHFDDLPSAFLALFQVATLSAWTDIMYSAMDADGEGAAPRRNATPAAAVYFVAAVIILCFLCFSLFTSVVVDNFARLKAVYEGSAFLTDEQRRWVATHRLIRSVKRDDFVRPEPPPKSAHARLWCYRLVSRKSFDDFILLAIFVNVCLMASQHYDQPGWHTDLLFAANLFFIVLFALEAALKVAGLGWRQYWVSRWNRFDLLVVVLSVAGEALGAGVGASAVRMLRSFRAVRAVKRMDSLRRMFDTLVQSVPALANISLLIFVIFFVFSVWGVDFFGSVRGFPRRTGFENFGASCLTLFIMSTGEGWEEYMNTARAETSDAAALYFCGFMIVAASILLELLVAVILDQFSDSGDTAQMALFKERIQLWAQSWRNHADATGSLRASNFVVMMEGAPPPFGLGRHLDAVRLLARLRQWRIPIRRTSRGGVDTWVVDFRTTLERIAETQFVPERQRGFEANIFLLKESMRRDEKRPEPSNSRSSSSSAGGGGGGGGGVARSKTRVGASVVSALKTGAGQGVSIAQRLLRCLGFTRAADEAERLAREEAEAAANLFTIDKWVAVQWIALQYRERIERKRAAEAGEPLPERRTSRRLSRAMSGAPAPAVLK